MNLNCQSLCVTMCVALTPGQLGGRGALDGRGVDLLNQLHVVKEGDEGDEVRVHDLVRLFSSRHLGGNK